SCLILRDCEAIVSKDGQLAGRPAAADQVLGDVRIAALAERKGFEPSIPLPAYTLSRGAPSTTRPPPHSALFALRRGAFLAGFRKRASLKRGAVEKACKTMQSRCFGGDDSRIAPAPRGAACRAGRL